MSGHRSGGVEPSNDEIKHLSSSQHSSIDGDLIVTIIEKSEPSSASPSPAPPSSSSSTSPTVSIGSGFFGRSASSRHIEMKEIKPKSPKRNVLVKFDEDVRDDDADGHRGSRKLRTLQ